MVAGVGWMTALAAVAVDDTLDALGVLAQAHRIRWGNPVVGITGSAGKTTTKELTAAALRATGATVAATQGNLNNLIGVPMTLLTLTGEDLAVIEMAKRYGKAVMPAGFTPTEILTAWQAGADVVKVFPASVGGPAYFKDVKGPLPQVQLMPTGGVDSNTTPEFIKAGACAVGAGSAMVDKTAVANKDWAKLTETARGFVDAVKQARA